MQLDQCTDTEKDWFPQRQICRASAELLVANRIYANLHEKLPWHDGSFPVEREAWAEKWSHNTPYRYDDGVRIWVAEEDFAPDDHFLTWPKADDDDDDEGVPDGST